jgi:hypothetical protein
MSSKNDLVPTCASGVSGCAATGRAACNAAAATLRAATNGRVCFGIHYIVEASSNGVGHSHLFCKKADYNQPCPSKQEKIKFFK